MNRPFYLDLMSLLPKRIKKTRKKRSSIICKRGYKALFSSFGITSIIFISLILCLSVKPVLRSFSGQDFSFLAASASEKISSQNLFAEPVKNFLRESPEMAFVQGNSLLGLSPTATVNPTTLGTILGDEQLDVKAPGEVTGDRDGVVEYIVESGDTLSSVADKFDISLDTILWANNLSARSVVKPGQKIMVLPVSGAIHLVRSGDTLGGIAKSYKAETEEIISFNNLSSEGDIFIGDLLVIPGGQQPPKSSHIAETPSIPLAESYFIFPVEGLITQGPHGAFGNAIDISNKCGKPVVAAAGGTVQRTGYVAIGGKSVNILHPNGVATYYGHLSSITVKPGQKIVAGEIIGYVGNTGYTVGATGCHLHFEVRGASNFLAKYKVGSKISW